MTLNAFDLQVGKWQGEQVYKTVDQDQFIDPSLLEYYIHSPYLDFFYRAYNSHIQV